MRKNQKSGFTTMELLITVAIITVLAGVVFLAVVNHQRNLALFERDNIAKEIFVSAQNHLTAAESQGYLSVDKDKGYGLKEGDGTYYYVVNGANVSGDNVLGFDQNSVLEHMLPFGSIDEMVRGGGDYIIRYKTNPGRVLDVFYASGEGTKYGYEFFEGAGDSYQEVLKLRGDDNKDSRRNYSLSGNGAVIGWFGGDAAKRLGNYNLDPPFLNIVNEERLVVEVNNSEITGHNPSLQLIIKGQTSDAVLGVNIIKDGANLISADSTNRITYDSTNDIYRVVLDDITTSGMHFADLNSLTNGSVWAYKDDKRFLPGENITVTARAFDNTEFSNIAESASKETNSLFADGTIIDSTNAHLANNKAKISNIRHLENLDKNISNLSDALVFNKAEQTNNFIWSDDNNNTKDFVNEIKKQKGSSSDPQIICYGSSKNASTSDAGCYLPVTVDLSNGLDYNGGGHSIYNIKVNYPGNSGLFESVASSFSIYDLKLVNFDIKDTSNSNTYAAGALAGELIGSDVRNVVAYNTTGSSGASGSTNMDSMGSNATIQSEHGNAGGLIGHAKGVGLSYSAAALIVKSEGTNVNVGGLIGKAETREAIAASGIPEKRTTVGYCYSGGHTNNGAYDKQNYNISAGSGSTVGGLIGDAGNSTISDSYSTCSVSGSTAGGFVGKISGGNIENCYVTGLVKTNPFAEGDSGKPNTTIGAVAGVAESTSFNECKYYLSISQVGADQTQNNKTVFVLHHYLEAIGDDETASKNAGINALDANADTYNAFVGSPEGTVHDASNPATYTDGWQPAHSYDSSLKTYYNGKYNLKTVYQLHYMSETPTAPIEYFVREHYGDWPSPEVFFINTPTS